MYVRNSNSDSFRRKLAAITVLIGWTVAVNAVVGALMLGHMISIPSANADAVGPNPWLSEGSNWGAFHIMAADCPCSEAVEEYLVGRGALPGVLEWVIYNGSEGELADDLRKAGFEVTASSAETLTGAFGVSGGPWLVVTSPDGTCRYSGGHSDGRDPVTRNYLDTSIIQRTQTGQAVDALAAYGCAISDDWRAATDPLGLKSKSMELNLKIFQ